jgi:hypothetical protein
MSDTSFAPPGTTAPASRGRMLLLVAGIAVLVTVIVIGLVGVKEVLRSRRGFAPDGWYYSRFAVHSASGGKASDAARDAVAQVELSRLDLLGVRQAKVRMTGDGFVLAVPPDPASLLDALSDAVPAVEFRPVVAVSRPKGKCAPGRVAGILCGRDGLSYTVAPAEVQGSDIRTASASRTGAARRWTVLIELTDRGKARFAALTGRLAGRPAPRNQVATVVDGSVISAPAVQAAITGGSLAIAGSYTETQARRLAAPFVAASAHLQVTHDEISQTPP